MLIGLLCMAVIGLAGFVLINHFSKNTPKSAPAKTFVSPTTTAKTQGFKSLTH